MNLNRLSTARTPGRASFEIRASPHPIPVALLNMGTAPRIVSRRGTISTMEEGGIDRPKHLTQEQRKVLERARELIADEQHWSQGQCARTSDGKPCSAFDPNASKFDAYGALTRAAYEHTSDQRAAAVLADAIEDAIPHPADARFRTVLVNISDKGGHEAVLDLFDKAMSS